MSPWWNFCNCRKTAGQECENCCTQVSARALSSTISSRKPLITKGFVMDHLESELPMVVGRESLTFDRRQEAKGHVFGLLWVTARTFSAGAGSQVSSSGGAASQCVALHAGGSECAERAPGSDGTDRHRQDYAALLPAAHPDARGCAGSGGALGFCRQPDSYPG